MTYFNQSECFISSQLCNCKIYLWHRLLVFASVIRTRQFLTIVGTASELERLVGVLEVVLDVSHLVVDGDQVLQVDARAHLDPERFSQFCSSQTGIFTTLPTNTFMKYKSFQSTRFSAWETFTILPSLLIWFILVSKHWLPKSPERIFAKIETLDLCRQSHKRNL